MSDIEDIKNRLDIVELVREYVQLKQAGSNWKACCPFHNEKTPSFMVSKDKQIWHCFGCSEGGDIFGFIQKIEGVEFAEALRILADKAGVKLSKFNPEVSSQKTKLMDICEAAANFFHQVLLKSDAGKIARDYLERRKVTSAEIEQFKLGYAPDSWDSLLNALKKKGFSEEDIFLAGLIVRKDSSAMLRTGRSGEFYDRFRGRLMFPIWDIHSNTVGFTGRILGPEKEGVGKYVNTPQTAIYDKSRVIYGLNFARQEIRKNDLAVLVEGNMDVVASHGAGVSNVVAASGTALTVEQIRLLKRYADNLALAFDSDPAGENAAERGIDLALEEGMNLRVIVLPDNFKDPDELVRSGEEGPDKWREAIGKACSIMEYYFDKVSAKYGFQKVEDKKKIAEILLSKIAKIPNQVEQTHWFQKLSGKIRVPEEILRASLPKGKKSGRVKVEEKTIVSAAKKDLLEDQLLALILNNANLLPKITQKVLPEMFINPQLREIYKFLVLYYNKYTDINLEELRKKLDAASDDRVEKVLLLADKEFGGLEKSGQEEELLKLVDYLRKNYFSQLRNNLIAEIKRAEAEQDKNKVEELTRELQECNEKLLKIN